ncbi:MAG: tetratricopeptide repeat protein, partial [Lysobacteraceae bacterium]
MAEVLPTHAGAAFDALGRGDAALAERAARAGLARTPGDVAWRVVLALALSAQRRPAEALPIFEALVAAEPGVPEHWTNLGNCLCELERET